MSKTTNIRVASGKLPASKLRKTRQTEGTRLHRFDRESRNAEKARFRQYAYGNMDDES